MKYCLTVENLFWKLFYGNIVSLIRERKKDDREQESAFDSWDKFGIKGVKKCRQIIQVHI